VRAPTRAAQPGPTLEHARAFTFTPADRGPDAPQTAAFREHVESLYGPVADWSWLDEHAAVSYDDMVRVIARDMAAELAGVDLAITVDASPDCRHESFPACRLKDLLDTGPDRPGVSRAETGPLVLGIGGQGTAGPFTALGLACARLRSGASRRAAVIVMEQRTLPPDRAAVRPRADTAVVLILGPDGPRAISPPGQTVTRARHQPEGRTGDPSGWPAPGTTVIVGADLGLPAPGTTLIRAADGHPCAGVWLALADCLAGAAPPAGPVLVVDRDPVLPYECWLTLSAAATPPAGVGRHQDGVPAARPSRRSAVPELAR
jgi:hypothetical protein